MNLKDFLTNRDSPPELYWALVLEKGWIQAGVWYIGETAAEVISVGPGAAWETEEELMGATDAALSSAIQKLPENYKEPTKTVFGVASSWVKDGEITEEYLEKIKKLCTELSLSPVGFVVLPEAIAHLYKSEEGSPLNAVILGLGSENLEISVFKLGNLAGTTQVSRSISLVEDVTEGLSRFEGAAPLPSRFIIYDGKEGDLEDARESLLQTSWEGVEKIKFLHTPKVEILNIDRKVLATCLAGAAEIGNVSQIDSTEVDKESAEAEEKEPNIIPPEAGWEGTAAESLGFAKGMDVSANAVKPAPPIPQSVPRPPLVRTINAKKIASEYFEKTKRLFHSFSRQRNISSGKKPPMFLGIIIAIIAIIVAGGIYWWFFPKAKVVVFVSPKRFEQQVQVSFSSNGETDLTNGIIPAKVITDTFSGDKTKSTTGVKLIGNKATGNIQIANGNGSPINLSAGTILTSSSGLKFVTNSQASVSGQLLPGSPGTADISVTAYDIGAQYNLAKGEVFGVGNYSRAMVAGTSLSDFAGGSSQEISAVSKDDQTNLETDLKNELIQEAKNEISSKISADEIFVDELASVDISKENFDHKINDSADSLKLSLSIDAVGLGADKVKLLDFAKQALKDKIPSGYLLKDDEIDFKFKFIVLQNGKYSYDVTIGANFLPRVDTKKIISQISGKTPSVAENYLDSISGFSRATVTLKPKFPGPLGTLPKIPGNITLEVRAE